MSYTEFIAWTDYARRKGGFNLGERIEDGFAMLAAVLAQLHGKRYNADHFKPQRVAQDQEASIGSVFALLKSKAVEGRR